MTDPIPDEAVEAAAKAMYVTENPGDPDAALKWDDGREGRADWTQDWLLRAHTALTAAAPHIAAQDRAEVERLRSHVARNGIEWCMCSRADRMNERRIPRCPYHGDGMAVQRNIAEQERDEARAALADLRAGIEAMRDAWWAGRCACLTCTGTRRHADALDVLLRGAK